MKAKEILYWCSIVAPLYDIVLGVIKAVAEIPDDVRKIHANRRYIEENERFYQEWSAQDMTDEEFDAKFNNRKIKKEKKKNG